MLYHHQLSPYYGPIGLHSVPSVPIYVLIVVKYYNYIGL